MKGWNWGTVRFGGEFQSVPEAVGQDFPISVTVLLLQPFPWEQLLPRDAFRDTEDICHLRRALNPRGLCLVWSLHMWQS